MQNQDANTAEFQNSCEFTYGWLPCLRARVAVNCHWDVVFWNLHARQLCAVTKNTDKREFVSTERDAFRR